MAYISSVARLVERWLDLGLGMRAYNIVIEKSPQLDKCPSNLLLWWQSLVGRLFLEMELIEEATVIAESIKGRDLVNLPRFKYFDTPGFDKVADAVFSFMRQYLTAVGKWDEAAVFCRGSALAIPAPQRVQTAEICLAQALAEKNECHRLEKAEAAMNLFGALEKEVREDDVRCLFGVRANLAQCYAVLGREADGLRLVAVLDGMLYQIPPLSPLRIPYARLLCEFGRFEEVFDDVCQAMQDCAPPEFVALLPAFKKFKILLEMSGKAGPMLDKIAGVVIQYASDIAGYAGGAEALVNMNFLTMEKLLEMDQHPQYTT